jgi:hypothetical protein
MSKTDKSGFSLWFTVMLNVFHLKMISFYRKTCKLVPNTRLSFFDFCYLCSFTTVRRRVFSFLSSTKGDPAGSVRYLKWSPMNSKFQRKLV